MDHNHIIGLAVVIVLILVATWIFLETTTSLEQPAPPAQTQGHD